MSIVLKLPCLYCYKLNFLKIFSVFSERDKSSQVFSYIFIVGIGIGTHFVYVLLKFFFFINSCILHCVR